jgi:acyl-CoA thioester hydrolase
VRSPSGSDDSLLTTYVGMVYPRDCDHMGHMNVAAYVAKFDEATWQLFARIGMDGTYFRNRKGAVGGVDQRLTYRRELFPGDGIQITTRVIELRQRVIVVRHELIESISGEIAAVCTTTAVHMDAVSRKASPFPDEVYGHASQLLEAEPS